MRTWTAAMAAVLHLAAAGAGAGQLGADGWERVDEPLPEFVVEQLHGEALRSGDLAGRVVMIDFWATWCAPCIKELPGLAEWHDRLGEDDVVSVLSFNVMDETEVLEKFVEKHDIHFPVYRADELADTLEVMAFPTKLIVDMRGEPTIVYRRAGYAPAEVVEPKVQEVVAAGE